MKTMCEQEELVLDANQIAELLGGQADNATGVAITAVMDDANAGAGHASFINDDKLDLVSTCRADLLIVSPDAEVGNRACVRVNNPGLAASFLQQRFFPRRVAEAGIHSSAVVEEGAHVDQSAEVGPWCVIHAGATIGANTILATGVVVGNDADIGSDCHLHERVILYREVVVGEGCVIHAGSVLGVDGFGYEWSGTRHEHMPQTGTVEIGAGCEIGANCVIDRATFGITRLGRGCILDNLVQVGHNCQIGDFVVLCGQVGLAGSSILETGAVMGGQSGAGGHITIGAGAQVGGGAKVFSNVAPGAKVAGNPAIDYMKHLRAAARRRK
ncbi:MAG: UDP-3-O-(3-hydroxymyristoyl)glucosamine N-acyltransferase [Planctomycetota bacterium]|nr:MAG: UDP-3-O-(3-hydroxymyristoyl)glucosamine N-acyltransferase [Planctomycetota bacterium]